MAACIGVAAVWHYTLAAGCLTTGTDRCPVYHERTWLNCCRVTLPSGPLCLESILHIWAAVMGDGPGQDPRSWAVPHLLRFWAFAVALPLALGLPLHGAAPAAGCLLTGMKGYPAAFLLLRSTCGGSSCLFPQSSSPVCTSSLLRTLAAVLHPIAQLGSGRQTENL